VRQHDKALRARFRERGERALDLVAPSRFQPKDGDAGPLPRRLDLPQGRCIPG
jgi:hypothetical protein